MARMNRHLMFMDMATVASKRSTCFRGNIGALIVKDHDIISMGYNGPPSGEDHCKGNECELRSTGGCLRSIHAEANAVKRAIQKLDGPLIDCTIYVTSSPCQECAADIYDSGIGRVFYRHPYRDPAGLQYLSHPFLMIEIYRVTEAGYIIDERTKNIVDPDSLR